MAVQTVARLMRILELRSTLAVLDILDLHLQLVILLDDDLVLSFGLLELRHGVLHFAIDTIQFLLFQIDEVLHLLLELLLRVLELLGQIRLHFLLLLLVFLDSFI